MSVSAGSLNLRVQIQRRSSVQDDEGQPKLEWETFLEVWASIKGQTGMGSIIAQQGEIPSGPEKYSIRIRYRTDVTHAHRVVYQGMIFDIKKVRLDIDGKAYTDLICQLGANDG